MSNTIRLKRASGSDPGASDLVTGELAIRTDTGKLFTKKDDNSVAEIGSGLSDGDKGDITISNSGATFTIDNNAVTTDKIANSSVNVNKIANNAITSAKILNGTIVNGDINSNAAIARTKLANVDVVDDTSPQLGGALGSNGNDINFADSDKAVFGSDGDLEIFHDGSDSYVQAISNGSGDLYVIANTKSIYLRPKTNENGIKIVPDGAVELYHDNSKKLETTANGLAQTGMLAIPDGGKDSGQNHIRFGNDGDLRIYHSGSHSFVQDVGTGSLKLAGADVQIVNSDNSAVLAQFIAGGKSELRHDGNTKFETSSSGVSVTGNVVVSGTVDGRDVATDGSKLDGIASGATNVTNTNQLTNGAGFITSADGGNANQLDGLDSTQFLRSDANDSASGFIQLSTGIGFNNTSRCTAAVRALSDGSTITVDFTNGIHHSVTLGGNRTFGNPSNDASAVGQSGSIFITQDGTGGRTASFHSDYKFAGGTAPTLSTGANAVDRLDYVIKASGVIHCVVTLDVK